MCHSHLREPLESLEVSEAVIDCLESNGCDLVAELQCLDPYDLVEIGIPVAQGRLLEKVIKPMADALFTPPIAEVKPGLLAGVDATDAGGPLQLKQTVKVCTDLFLGYRAHDTQQPYIIVIHYALFYCLTPNVDMTYQDS